MFGICANVQFPSLHVHNWSITSAIKSNCLQTTLFIPTFGSWRTEDVIWKQNSNYAEICEKAKQSQATNISAVLPLLQPLSPASSLFIPLVCSISKFPSKQPQSPVAQVGNKGSFQCTITVRDWNSRKQVWLLTVQKQNKWKKEKLPFLIGLGQHKRAGTFLVHWHRYLCPGNEQKIRVRK